MDKFSAIPRLTVDIVATNEEGQKHTTTIQEGTILQDLVYKENGSIVTRTGKVTEIMVAGNAMKNDYKLCACNLKSKFADNVEIEGFVLDSSSIYGAEVSMVFIRDIRGIGGVIDGSIEIDPATAEPGAIAEAIATMEPGQELVLLPGKITEDLVIPAGVVVKGTNAGVSATTGYRAQDGELEGETVFDGAVLIGANSVLDGITLTGKALPRIGAVAATAAIDSDDPGMDIDFTMKNCRVIGLDDGTDAKKQYGIRPNNWNDRVLLKVENCYFGNSPKIYNLFELNCTLQSGSYVKNNVFAAQAFSNNAVCLYQVANNSVIDVQGNIFDYSCNAVRVGTRGNAKFTLNIKNNTYRDTCEPNVDAEGNVKNNWGGFMIVQSYDHKTESMKNILINIDGTKNQSENDQLFYYYQDKGCTVLDEANRPKVYVNGELASWENNSWIIS